VVRAFVKRIGFRIAGLSQVIQSDATSGCSGRAPCRWSRTPSGGQLAYCRIIEIGGGRSARCVWSTWHRCSHSC